MIPTVVPSVVWYTHPPELQHGMACNTIVSYRQQPLWLYCNALLNTVSAFRLPSTEDSIECATCALQQGTRTMATIQTCIAHFIYVGQLTQLIHWIGNGNVSDAFVNQYMYELNLPAVNTEYTPGGLGS